MVSFSPNQISLLEITRKQQKKSFFCLSTCSTVLGKMCSLWLVNGITNLDNPVVECIFHPMDIVFLTRKLYVGVCAALVIVFCFGISHFDC